MGVIFQELQTKETVNLVIIFLSTIYFWIILWKLYCHIINVLISVCLNCECDLLHIYETAGILDTTGYIQGDIPKMLF